MRNKDSIYILFWAKKIRAIEHLGNKCSNCDCNDVRLMEFHHIDNNKETAIADILDHSWSNIILELDKCVLLCKNCHRVLHHSCNTKNSRNRNNKNILLEFIGKKECDECKWNAHQCGLQFHHKDSNKKEFDIGDLNVILHTVDDLEKKLIDELDKCQLLCTNCHQLKHINYKFNLYEDMIHEKSKTFKVTKRLDREKIRNLYRNGMKQSEICKKLGLSKSSVFCALEDIRTK